MSARSQIRARAAERQRSAADPAVSAWVSANAGSGKTRVLIDRVARLLLAGADPSRILCVTYTKAAAAEMSTRLFQRLGHWSMASDEELIKELEQLGAQAPPRESLDKARRLFASALETPGGLKIETIHAFCQRLMQRFPAEAKVPPEFDVIDEREAEGLLANARAAVFHNLSGDAALGDAIAIALDSAGEHNFGEMLKDGIVKRTAIERFFAEAGNDEEIAARIRALLGLATDEDADSVEAACYDDENCNAEALKRVAEVMSQSTASEAKRGALISNYLAAASRAQHFEAYCSFFFTQGGELRKTLINKATLKGNPGLDAILLKESERVERWSNKLRAARLADLTIAALSILKHIFDGYERLKAAHGALDYDDLIAKTLGLLEDSAYAWVHFKLDGGIDHVLIDEAQDTSPDQWQIVRRLTAEFFTLESASETRARTMFAVGDQKQSIYSFQGADPRGFSEMREHFGSRLSVGPRLGRRASSRFPSAPWKTF